MKADKVCDDNVITVGLGFSNKGLVNNDVSQADDCKLTSPISNNCFDQIVQVAKVFIPIKFVQEGMMQKQNLVPKVSKSADSVGSSDISSHSVLYHANLSNDEVNNILDKQGVILQNDDISDELKIEKVDAIHIHTTKKLPKGHVIKHCKQVDKTRSSSSKGHGSDGKGNKNCFSGSKSTRNNSLNGQMKNYSSRSPYVKSVSLNSKIKVKKDSPSQSQVNMVKVNVNESKSTRDVRATDYRMELKL
ncbi:hypothetical protein L1987_20318 [Smallanthus sonchifolius]|uniref:Uncharacterized protein n=1 Tax=Smallanthus sonchifolius TaxID=185202 RepID=A0ACB9IS97_9ASTR|nr:hypothetical protein L1987_20318 [Smallanthus sonchifolius]